MATVRITADVFERGVKIMTRGELRDLDAADLDKALRRGWAVRASAEDAAESSPAATSDAGKGKRKG